MMDERKRAALWDGLLSLLLGREGIDKGSVDHWIIHSGGRKVIDGIRDAANHVQATAANCPETNIT